MNFTAADILLSTAAFFLLGLFLLAPGYALGWLLNLASFRSLPQNWRLLMSLPLSIALTPILVYLLGRVSFGWPVWALYVLLAGVFLAVFRVRDVRVPGAVWLAGGCCFAIGVLSLVDLQLGHRLYYSVAAYDYSFRAAITGAFVRASVLPAANPFFFAGTPQPFRYHYFWFMIAALPIRLAEAVFGHTELAPRYAVIASTVWAGLGLMASAALYIRFVAVVDERFRKRAAWFAVALFGVSGLDIVAVLPQELPSLGERQLSLWATVDWWNTDQVAGWLDTMLWVPHSAAALVACVTGFLILWNPPRFRWQSALGAGLAFASAAGLSVYVTAVFAAFCGLWALYLLLRHAWVPLLLLLSGGVCAVLLAAPFLRELVGNPGAQGSFARLTIRQFDPWMQLLETFHNHSPWVARLGNFIFLPLNYLLELGVFFIAGLVWFISRWKQPRASRPYHVALALMVITPLILCSFTRSATINMNDLGLRGMLPAQFALLLIAAEWLAGNGFRSRFVKGAVALGILTSVYELSLLRTFTVLSDDNLAERSDAISADPNAGLRGFSARQIYQALDRSLPLSAVVQHNPDGHHDILAGLYANRQFAIRDLPTAVTFSGDATGPNAAFTPVADLFNGNRNDPKSVCREFSIDVLVVKDNDEAWDDKDGWVWKHPPLFRADRAMAFACR